MPSRYDKVCSVMPTDAVSLRDGDIESLFGIPAAIVEN